MWITIIFIVIAVAILAYGSAKISSGMYVNAVCSNPNGDEVLLTFDDGPDPQQTPKVLEVLRRHNVRAMFFLIGQQVQQHPELVRQIIADGHVIGSHSFYHNPWHNFQIHRRYDEGLQKAEDALKACGVEKITDFRPPLGITNATVATCCTRRKYTVWGWNVRSFDTNDEPRQKVLERIERKLKPGAIVLLHDRLPESEWLAEEVIKAIEKRGLKVQKKN